MNKKPLRCIVFEIKLPDCVNRFYRTVFGKYYLVNTVCHLDHLSLTGRQFGWHSLTLTSHWLVVRFSLAVRWPHLPRFGVSTDKLSNKKDREKVNSAICYLC